MRNQRYDVPPLDPLLAFEAAARNLSFTKAAAELHLTQSAVSRQIQQLEEHLGIKLFERRARALLLTENGQLFYRAAQDALAEVARQRATIARHGDAEYRRGRDDARVRVAVADTAPRGLHARSSACRRPHLGDERHDRRPRASPGRRRRALRAGGQRHGRPAVVRRDGVSGLQPRAREAIPRTRS